jgi:hypothetical protein
LVVAGQVIIAIAERLAFTALMTNLTLLDRKERMLL